MGIPTVGVFGGQTNGSVTTFDYTLDFAAIKTSIDLQTAAIVAANKFNELQWSPLAVKTTGTPIAVLSAQATALNNMSTMMASMMKTQSEIAAKLTSLQVAIAQISTQVAAGVTTSQVHLTETIKNNKFQQQTTNAALVRSNIEPTVVAPTSLTASIKETIDSVAPVKAAMATANLVEQSISTAISQTSLTVTNLIAESYVGIAASNAFAAVKGWINLNKPEELTKATQAEASALLSSTKTGDK